MNLNIRSKGNSSDHTLTTLALTYLIEAEKLYGKKTQQYEYGGIELTNDDNPRIWFPFPKFVVIKVTKDCLHDIRTAIFQISHEVIHILSPTGQPVTNVLEEGLATYFSKKVTDRDTGDNNFAMTSISSTPYFRPYQLVNQLLEQNPNAITELRKIQPTLGNLTENDFKAANINFDKNLIAELVSPMKYS